MHVLWINPISDIYSSGLTNYDLWPHHRIACEMMSEVASLVSLVSGLRQAQLGNPVAVNFNGPISRPHQPAPPPLNDICREIQKRLDALDIKDPETFLERMELKSRWNHSLVVTRLPNTILFRIFVHFSRPLPWSDEDCLGWMKLMLVCRSWCDMARATPTLWRTIDVGGKTSWMKLALTRSASAAIDISFYSGVSEKHVSLLRPHYHRLHSLRLQHWSPDALRVIRNILPVLEVLEIRGDTRRKDTAKAPYTDLEITRERHPSLKVVFLSRAIIPKDPLFYAQLRKLSLKACPCKFSLEQFVQILSDSPGLEHLHLDRFLQQLQYLALGLNAARRCAFYRLSSPCVSTIMLPHTQHGSFLESPSLLRRRCR
ncbi:hypothetical protein LXA43DRAFT_747323 [Ganoderma leucocontextum]|nr:hypothetical protein LXA43DRAFT_747323 [Ganoderma leucocontextum]